MARRSGGGKILEKHTPSPTYAFGTPEEIAERDKVARQGAPTHFEQIGPEDNSGMNLANPVASHRSGPIKFGRGISGG